MRKVERRAVPRYRVKLPIDVEIDDEIMQETTSIEVSLAGVRLACEGPIARRLLNKYIQVTPGKNVTAKLKIKTPDTIECKARVVTVNRISQNCFNVGLNFLDFEDDCYECWQSYISNL